MLHTSSRSGRDWRGVLWAAWIDHRLQKLVQGTVAFSTYRHLEIIDTDINCRGKTRITINAVKSWGLRSQTVRMTEWLLRWSVDWKIIKFVHLIPSLVVNVRTICIEVNIDIRKIHWRHLELLQRQQAKETNMIKSAILLIYIQKHVLRRSSRIWTGALKSIRSKRGEN